MKRLNERSVKIFSSACFLFAAISIFLALVLCWFEQFKLGFGIRWSFSLSLSLSSLVQFLAPLPANMASVRLREHKVAVCPIWLVSHIGSFCGRFLKSRFCATGHFLATGASCLHFGTCNIHTHMCKNVESSEGGFGVNIKMDQDNRESPRFFSSDYKWLFTISSVEFYGI